MKENRHEILVVEDGETPGSLAEVGLDFRWDLIVGSPRWDCWI